jgi:hypothetical protein
MSKPRYAERYEGVFVNLDTPPYEYQEYPKWITTTLGQRIVKDRREELELLAFTPAKIPTPSDVKELGQALDDVQGQLDSKTSEVEALQKQLAAALSANIATPPAVSPVAADSKKVSSILDGLVAPPQVKG